MALHFAPLLWVFVALVWDTELDRAWQWYLSRVRLPFGRLFAQPTATVESLETL